jgi:hypothetical protein
VHESQTEVQIALRLLKVRIDPEGLGKMSYGLLEPSLLSQRNPQVVVRLRIMGTDSQHFCIMLNGLLVFPLAI